MTRSRAAGFAFALGAILVPWGAPCAAAQDTARAMTLPGSGPAEVAGVPGLEWRLVALDGREVRLEGLTGRPLVVNVWATWCAPCVAELRSLERLHRSLGGDGVAFVLVSPEDRHSVAAWVRRRGYDLPFYVEGTRMPESFGLEAVPTTWVLDARGEVVLKHRGAADWDRDDVRALLRSLAAPPKASGGGSD